MSASLDTAELNDRLARLRAGDAAAREELTAAAAGRLERLARAMLRRQFDRLGRWVETGDVLQSALVRLWSALAHVTPDSPLHFHRLAATAVRRELIDLARHYYGPHGAGANHASAAGPDNRSGASGAVDPAAGSAADPGRAAEWVEFHEQVQRLPADEAAVTDLLYYQGLTQDQAADLLGVDVRTVQRRWQRARRALGALLTGD